MVQAGLPETVLVDELVSRITRGRLHNDRRRETLARIPAPPRDTTNEVAVAKWRAEMQQQGHRVGAQCQVSESS